MTSLEPQADLILFAERLRHREQWGFAGYAAQPFELVIPAWESVFRIIAIGFSGLELLVVELLLVLVVELLADVELLLLSLEPPP